MNLPLIIVIMGVSGSGKSSVAQGLSARLGWPFQEGDALHPPANIAKMSAGVPLGDADRAPWLAAIAEWIEAAAAERRGAIVTCSGLKRVYRDQLRQGRPYVRLVLLSGPQVLIASRLAARTGHFMPGGLLQSQFDDLEPPSPEERVLVVPVDRCLSAQVAAIEEALTAPDWAAGP